jgi:hypothetical protein
VQKFYVSKATLAFYHKLHEVAAMGEKTFSAATMGSFA